MIWVNLNMEKNTDWRQTVNAYPNVSNAFQTYIVHDNKTSEKASEPWRWWTHQSNVYGVIVAASSIPKDTVASYPKVEIPYVAHFIPHLTVDSNDFRTYPSATDTPKLNILSFDGNNKTSFFRGLEEGFGILRQNWPRKCNDNPKEIRYFGQTLGLIRGALRQCEGETADPTRGQDDTAGMNVLRQEQANNRAFRLPQDVRRTHDPLQPWMSTEEWLFNTERQELCRETDAGAMGDNPPTGAILAVLEQELKVTVDRARTSCPIRGAIKCVHMQSKPGPSAKRAKIQKMTSTMILNIDMDKKTGIFKKDFIINSIVWLIPYTLLEKLINSHSAEIFKHGDSRLVTSQSTDKRRIQVKPPLKLDPEKADDHDYICVLLGDLHQFIFLYENFRATAMRLQAENQNTDPPSTTDLSKRSDAALRAWEGYGTGSLEYFLGPKGERGDVIKYCTGKFREAYGSSWTYTAKQKDILQKLDSSFSVLDCIAGSGKTTILVSLALYMIHVSEEGPKGCLHYMTETQEMVQEFIARVREVQGSDEGIAPIGYDHVERKDRLDSYLRERLDKRNIPMEIRARRVQKAVDFLQQYAEVMLKWECKETWTTCYRIFKMVLSIHHTLLHNGYYVERRKAQVDELRRLTVIACTTATANRLNGGSNPWSESWGQLEKTLCVADELQTLGRVEVAGLSYKSISCNTADTYFGSPHLKKKRKFALIINEQ